MKCKPRANNPHFLGKMGFPQGGVDAGNPLRYYYFPSARALSESWMKHFSTNCLGLPVYPPVFFPFSAG